MVCSVMCTVVASLQLRECYIAGGFRARDTPPNVPHQRYIAEEVRDNVDLLRVH